MDVTNSNILVNIFKNNIDKITNLTDNNFIILRNYDNIVEEIISNSDVDILIPHKSHIYKLIEEFKNDFHIYEDNNPCLYGANNHVHFIHRKYPNIHYDIVTGLYYRSIMNSNILVNIGDGVTDNMVSHCRPYTVFLSLKLYNDSNIIINIPSHEDEIIHLICHMIFDKHKNVVKYVDHIQDMLKECGDFIDVHYIKNMLSKIFYNFGTELWSKIYNNCSENDNWYSDYISFSNY